MIAIYGNQVYLARNRGNYSYYLYNPEFPGDYTHIVEERDIILNPTSEQIARTVGVRLATHPNRRALERLRDIESLVNLELKGDAHANN